MAPRPRRLPSETDLSAVARGNGGRFGWPRLGFWQAVVLSNFTLVLGIALLTAVVRPWLGVNQVSATSFFLMIFAGALLALITNGVVFWHHLRRLAELVRALDHLRPASAHPAGDSSAKSLSATEMVKAARTAPGRLKDESLHLSARLLMAMEAERKAIGRELHDDVGQILAAALLKVGLASQQARDNVTESDAALQAAQELLQQAIRRVRTVMYELRPAMLDDLGLAAALRWYCGARADKPDLKVVMELQDSSRLPGHLEIALYRVGQEAIANAVKHSTASTIEVSLEIRPGYVVLSVRDNGKGFELQRAHPGLGLASMHERIASLGGTLTIVTAPGEGTHVSAVLLREPPADTAGATG